MNAEIAGMRGKDAMVEYNAAITGSRNQGMLLQLGLANERAAGYLSRINRKSDSLVNYRQAIEAYA
jgi:hypothetical protein